MFKQFIYYWFVSVLLTVPLVADITIPVSTGPNPTCLGRLYNDILIPRNIGSFSDPNSATRYAQSREGVLGITIFFEIRPPNTLGDPDNDQFYRGLMATGYTFLDDFMTNTGIKSSTLPANWTLQTATKNQSSAWHHETWNGEGTLLEGQRNTFYSILNGNPNAGDCNGLIYSWLIAEQLIQNTLGLGRPPAYVLRVYNPTPRSLFFRSNTTDKPSVFSGYKQYLYQTGQIDTPKFGGGVNKWYFWGLSNLNGPW